VATSIAAARNLEEIYCLLVPMRQLRLIVPRTSVAEVVRYVHPDKPWSAPAWFRGFVPWNTLKVPLVSFEELCGHEPGDTGGRTRIAIFHSISGKLDTGYLGLMTEGFPQLVRVNREVVQLDDRHPWPAEGPVVCQVRMINEYPLVPDLERLELMVQGCLERRGARLT
jgi:chemosensory pili system protein ChpC